MAGYRIFREPYAKRIAWSVEFEGRAGTLHDLVAVLSEIKTTLASPRESSAGPRSDGLPSFSPPHGAPLGI